MKLEFTTNEMEEILRFHGAREYSSRDVETVTGILNAKAAPFIAELEQLRQQNTKLRAALEEARKDLEHYDDMGTYFDCVKRENSSVIALDDSVRERAVAGIHKIDAALSGKGDV